MKKIILLFLLSSCVSFAQETKPTGAWLPVHVDWKHAPASINAELETGTTTVLYIDDQQHIALVACVVNHQSGQYTISRGDGQVISRGEWDGHLPGGVRYRLMSRTVALTGEKLPGPWHDAKLARNSKGHLLFEGKEYRRIGNLESNIRDLLRSAPITP